MRGPRSMPSSPWSGSRRAGGASCAVASVAPERHGDSPPRVNDRAAGRRHTTTGFACQTLRFDSSDLSRASVILTGAPEYTDPSRVRRVVDSWHELSAFALADHAEIRYLVLPCFDAYFDEVAFELRDDTVRAFAAHGSGDPYAVFL